MTVPAIVYGDQLMLTYCLTAAGEKLHLTRPDGMTWCGFRVHQLVLPEQPLPDSAMCEWCRAARDKENR